MGDASHHCWLYAFSAFSLTITIHYEPLLAIINGVNPMPESPSQWLSVTGGHAKHHPYPISKISRIVYGIGYIALFGRCICLLVYPSIHPSVRPSIHPSIHQSSISLSVYPSINISTVLIYLSRFTGILYYVYAIYVLFDVLIRVWHLNLEPLRCKETST